jgi:2-polyprenyl-3-methyl-5-hydroxy-6-metoxy-1,4-benzoquinol methylase
MNSWGKSQQWEKQWWHKCLNTYFEEQKQLIYAEKMGLEKAPSAKTPYQFDMGGKSVLDVGGGPVSLLLKCVNVKGKVVDPLKFPKWVMQRYKLAEIKYEEKKGEDISEVGWDEVWIYNCLAHTESPEKIIENAKRAGGLIRIFEWVDTRASLGHPAILTKDKLDYWLDGEGKVEEMSGVCKGKAYYGIFPT